MTIDKYGRHISWNSGVEGKSKKYLATGMEVAKLGGSKNIDAEHHKIVNLNEPQDPDDAVNKKYADRLVDLRNYPGKSIDFGNKIIRNIGNPEACGDGISRKFLEKHVPYMVHQSDPGYVCHNKRLTNVGEPLHHNDAITLQYMINYVRDACIRMADSKRDSSNEQQDRQQGKEQDEAGKGANI